LDAAAPRLGRDDPSGAGARIERRPRGACVEPLRHGAGDRRRDGGRICLDRGLCGMSHAYRLSALKLVSDIELPELMPWDGRRDAPAELVFRLGKVPCGLDAPDHVAAAFETKGHRQYLTTFPDEARVLV